MAIVNRSERLPEELKLAIIDVLPNFSTLSALIHASPNFYRTYAGNREKVLTKFTIQQLAKQVASIPNRGPTTLWVLLIKGLEPDPDLRSAILSCCAQARAGTKEAITLTVSQCIALRTVIWMDGSKNTNLRVAIGNEEYLKILWTNEEYLKMLWNFSNYTKVMLPSAAEYLPERLPQESIRYVWHVEWHEELDAILRPLLKS